MSRNRYIFQDQLSVDQMASRIPAASYRTEDDETIQDMLEEAGRDFHFLVDNKPESFCETLRVDLGDEQYGEYIRELFEEYGEKGDSFNLQFYQIDGVNYGDLKQNANEAHGALEETEENQFSLPTSLKDVRAKDSEEVLDLRFEVVGHPENMDVEDATKIRDKSGDYIDVEDLGVEGMEAIVTENKLRVEVRVYAGDEIVTMSNSEMKSSVEDDVLAAIKRWGKDDE